MNEPQWQFDKEQNMMFLGTIDTMEKAGQKLVYTIDTYFKLMPDPRDCEITLVHGNHKGVILSLETLIALQRFAMTGVPWIQVDTVIDYILARIEQLAKIMAEKADQKAQTN